MKIEVNKKEDIYELIFIKADGSKTLKLTEESYLCLESHFKSKKANKQGKKPIPPKDIEEVREYFKIKGYALEAANKFFDYYETTGWKGANDSPILNWKAKAQAVWFTDKNKIKEVAKSESSFFRN